MKATKTDSLIPLQKNQQEEELIFHETGNNYKDHKK